MKARRKIKILSLAIIVIMIASANVSFSQDEYDDMYFNPKDRKEVKFTEEVTNSNVSTNNFESKAIAKNTTKSDVINPTYSPSEYGDLEENYSAKNVNPEYIARYKNNPKGSAGNEEVAEGDSYYDDYYERTVMPGETEKGSNQGKYAYPSSYYGGYNAATRTRMYANPRMMSYGMGGYPYDPFYGGGYGSGWNLGLGYTFGYMPGFSMNLGYSSGWGYNPYGFYDPFSPFANPYYSMNRFYDPFYSPWAYDPYYSSMRYGYGGMGYCPSPYYGYGGMGTSSVTVQTTGSKVSNTGAIPESNRYESPSYRNRVVRGSDQYRGDRKDVPNSRTVASRNSTDIENQSVNARTAANRDFSQSQNEYYNRTGTRNATTAVSTSTNSRSTVTSTRSASRSTVGNTNTARVRSSRVNSDYSRPSYRSTREQRAISSGRSSWSNSGTYRSSRSSGNSYSTPSRSRGSSYSGSSGSSYKSSSSSGSSGSYSGGSRSSGSSGGGSRNSRGN